jgi:hypothetical protein
MNIPKYVEGYVDYMMPNPDMVKNVREVPDTELLIILSEIYTNVQKHETLFSVYNIEYKKETINMNDEYSIEENIFNIFKYLKKHDDELVNLTESSKQYVPSNTLSRLIDGSLLEDLRSDLYKIKNFPARSMMPKKTTDADELESQGLKLSKKAEDLRHKPIRGDVKDETAKDLLRESKKKYAEAEKKRVTGLPADDENLPLDDSPRITQGEIESRLLMVTLYHIKQVVEYQEVAVKGLQILMTDYMKRLYPEIA